MCSRHDSIVNSRHTNLHCRNISWWFRTVAVCENCTSSSSQGVKDAKEISQGEIKLFRHHHVWKRCASSSSPLETHTRVSHEKSQEMKKAKHIKYSLCFLYSHVNMRVSDCSIFSTDHQNDERGWCKSYNCCSVLERELAQRGRKGGAKEERGERQTDRQIQRQSRENI